MKTLKRCSLLLILWSTKLYAQEVLPLNQAVATALKANFDIQIAQKEAAIASNNNTVGNAGMLPRLNAGLTQNNTVNNTRQEFFNGTINERDGARSSNFNGQVQLQWTIFDGLAMFTTKQALSNLETLGQQQMQLNIEFTLADVMNQYHQLAAQYQRLRILKENISISAERLRLAEQKKLIGTASDLEVLAARVDLNADSASYLRSVNLYKNACASLSALMNITTGTEWVPADTSTELKTLVFADLLNKYQQQNSSLQQARTQYRISQLNRKLVNNSRMPVVTLNGVYQYTQSQAQVGILQSNRSFGPSYGVSANLPLFDGLNTQRRYQEQKIREEMAALQEQNIDLQLRTSLNNNFNDYTNNRSLLELELRNMDAARNTLNIALEKYRLGLINNLELREVQRNYLLVQDRLWTAWLSAKQAEVNLQQLCGELLK